MKPVSKIFKCHAFFCRIISVWLLFLSSLNTQAQQPRFKTLSLPQGLSQSTVNCIIEDRQGFMWLGTQDGLNRFDGYSFKIFKHNPSDKNSISDNFVQSLYEDHQGKIWIGTYGAGLDMYDPVTQEFVHYELNNNDLKSLSNNIIMSICEDGDNQLWVGTSNGLNKFNRKSKTFTRYMADGKPGSIINNKIRCLLNDSHNRLWVGTSAQGINLYNAKTDSFSNITTVFENDLNQTKFIQNILEDHLGMLWISTSGSGVICYDPLKNIIVKKINADNPGQYALSNNEVWTAFEDLNGILWFGTYGGGLNRFGYDGIQSFRNDPSDPSSLSNDIILCSFKCRNGTVWIGTLGGGACYFNPGKGTFEHIKQNPLNKNSLNERMVMSIFEDYENRLWIGTYGGGLNIYDTRSGEFTYYKNDSRIKNGIPGNIVRCIYQDSDKNKWIGTYEGGLSLWTAGSFINYQFKESDPQSLSHNDVWSIIEDSYNNLWVGTWGGGLNRLDRRTGKFDRFRNDPNNAHSLSHDKVIALHVSRGKELWIGTNGGGLNKFNYNTNNFKHYKNNPSDKNSLSNNRVRCIFEDKKGRIWVGTDGGGLNMMQPNETFKVFNEKDGLPNNVIYAILEDNSNNLWLSTNNGLCRFNTVTFSVQNYDISDGLQSNEFNQGARFKNSQGVMYFGGINGITRFKPSVIARNNNIPPVHVTALKLFGEELKSDTAQSYKKHLTFKHDQNFLSFEFTALDFTAPEKNQYAVKMEGFDKDWIMLGNQRVISYTNLDPGTYNLRIKASNNDKVWNEQGSSLTITITPPFYKTKLFYVLCVLSCLLIIYLVFKWRTKRLQREKLTLEKEVTARTNEVVLQKEIIERKNKDITDSINYAQRIQQAILPSQQAFFTSFPDSFILYKPKDIVSGDFYWMDKNESETFVAVADCTGHGVPGAFMSIVSNNLLNQAVNEQKLSGPNLILNEVNKSLSRSLKNKDNITLYDGMDISLCSINTKEKKLQFAGANNPLWIIKRQTGQLIEIKGDKKAIGAYSPTDAPFTNHAITWEPGDQLYIFSDGYADQFGGEKGKKFKYSQMKQMIIENQHLSMKQQHTIYNDALEKWKGGLEQVDDICMIGIRLS